LAVANETATPFLPDFMRIPTMRDFDSKLIENTRIAINNPSVRMAINDKISETSRQEIGRQIQETGITTPVSKIISLPCEVSSFIDEYALID
jgi:hypothetical protein